MGEIDKALEWLERCVEGHHTPALPARDFALFDPIRSLLRKMNLE
jgi:hypothetical protein